MALSIGRRSPLSASGWKGVRDLSDPYEVPPQYFSHARNLYLPEPGSGAGAYARPGFRLANSAARLGDPATDPVLSRAGWVATASGVAGGAAANVLDGNAATGWSTGAAVVPGTDFLKIDTVVQQRIGRIVASSTSFAGQVPTAGNIQTSVDGVAWTTRYAWVAADVATNVLDISFAPTVARYVRLLAEATAAGGAGVAWKVGEFNAYANGNAGGGYGQGVAVATIEDGTRINFLVVNGRLYRTDSALAVFTDVTPSNIAIDQSARVHLTPFSNRMVVNDGVHSPWVMSSLQATPVTATPIDYTGDGVAWVAYGPAVVYDGAIVFIVRSRNNVGTPVQRTSRIGWSEPDDPFTGYFQPNFDNEWDVVENGTEPIYALLGTNSALDYWRDSAIGYLSGTIGADFRTTANKDAIDEATGTRAPATVQAFGNRVFFADAEGRPQSIVNGQLNPLWEQLRRVVTPAATRWPDITKRTACAAIVPELDLYLVALWSPDPTQAALQSPTTLYAFHAGTGVYVGEWVIAPGIEIHAIGLAAGADNQDMLVVLGSKGAATVPQVPGTGGYVWLLSSLEDGVWVDNNVVPDIQGTVPFGYAADMMLNVDRVVAIVEEVQTDSVARAAELTPDSLVLAIGASSTITAVLRNTAGGVVDGVVQTWIVDDLTLASVTPLTGSTATVLALAATGTVHIQAQIALPDGTTFLSNTCTLTLGDPAAAISAIGGTIVDIGGFRVHTFDADGTFQVLTGSANADVLAVGGGGAGGGVAGSGVGCGGGGGGGVVEQHTIPVTIGSYTVKVGAGGVGALASPGASGEPSSFDVLVSASGGGGGGGVSRNGTDGGSGGGGSSATTTPGVGGVGVVGQGHNGGNGGVGSPGAGGGGAGAVGVAGGVGTGGAGASSSLSGAAVNYGGGGGGGHGSNGFTGGVGGIGGGHDGGTGPIGAATANLGGGGGGSGGSVNGIGGSGGSGVVIIRYPIP